jgi:hypothetical protein
MRGERWPTLALLFEVIFLFFLAACFFVECFLGARFAAFVLLSDAALGLVLFLLFFFLAIVAV